MQKINLFMSENSDNKLTGKPEENYSSNCKKEIELLLSANLPVSPKLHYK
jgi:hypothetical protein